MKWLPIKMNFLPLIFQEINFVTEDYITTLNKIRQKEKELGKEQKNQKKFESDKKSSEESPSKMDNKLQEQTHSEYELNKEKEKTEIENEDNEELEKLIKKYNALRSSISKRINELEDFYEDNIEDVRVSNFEKARLRLKKLLMYSYETINKVENSSYQKNIFIRDENNHLNKKITEDIKKKIIENNISLEKQMVKERKKEEEKVKKKLLGEEKQKKVLNKRDNIKNNKRLVKVKATGGFSTMTDKARKSSVMSDSEYYDGFDLDEYNKSREIIFKIKLKEDEYKLLLKEKKNKGNISPYLFK
jgi:hypothetical protein